MLEKLILAMCYNTTNLSFLLFDGRAAYAAVLTGEIKGFKISPKIVTPNTYKFGSIRDIWPDLSTNSREEWEKWLRENKELADQFMKFYKPKNAEVASEWAYVLSNR